MRDRNKVSGGEGLVPSDNKHTKVHATTTGPKGGIRVAEA